MESKIDTVLLTREIRKQQNLPISDENTDVIVKMLDGDYYIASFFSFDSLARLQEKHKKNKEFLEGNFFWVPNMILVKECSEELIRTLIIDLMKEKIFKKVFQKL